MVTVNQRIMKLEDQKERAEQAGQEAAESGRGTDANPHEIGSILYTAWLKGYGESMETEILCGGY